MGAFESILHLIGALTPGERRRLVRVLAEDEAVESQEELAVGQRGLASWSESAQPEDWSAYYPPGLEPKKAG